MGRIFKCRFHNRDSKAGVEKQTELDEANWCIEFSFQFWRKSISWQMYCFLFLLLNVTCLVKDKFTYSKKIIYACSRDILVYSSYKLHL